jgi:hypothetical protein
MRKISFTIVTIILLTQILSTEYFCQDRQKLAQTGLKFLSVSLNPRFSGMSDAITALGNGSSAMLYNPSVMAEMNSSVDCSFGRTTWIADIDYIYATAAMDLWDGKYGTFGVSLVAVDYGELIGTIVGPNDDGYIEVGTFKPISMALGLGYAKSLSEKFSVGGNIKYIKQSLGTSVVGLDENGKASILKHQIEAFAFDFGILYHTGFKSLDFGMSVRNFAAEINYVDEDFQIPLVFKLGMSINAVDFLEIDKNIHSLLVAVDASHPRDYAEQVSIGGDYTFMNTFSIRAGYTFPVDEQEYSVGLGLKQQYSGVNFAVDYSYTPFGIFSDVHRISVNIGY